MRTPFTSREIAVLRRNHRRLALSMLPVGLLVGLLGTLALTKTPVFAAPIFHVLIGGSILFYYLWQTNPRPVLQPAEVRAGEEGVTIDGALVLPRARIKSGFVIPRPEGTPIVRLEPKGIGTALDLCVPDEEEGRKLLVALGLDASQTVTRFDTMAYFGGQRLPLFMAIGSLFGLWMLLVTLIQHVHPDLIILAPLLLLLYLGLMMRARTRLWVGADGLLTRWLWKEQFHPYDQVDDVHEYEDEGLGKNKRAGVKVLLTSGKVLTIPLVAKGKLGAPRVRLVAERIRESLGDHRRGAQAMDTALLRRGERAPSEWVRSLRAMGTGASADHRHAPVPAENLLRVAEDPRAQPAVRASAAIALSGALDDDSRARLRAAAEATALPKVRIALEAAAREASEEELTEALAALEAEEAAQRAG
jgi:hypothetical protein